MPPPHPSLPERTAQRPGTCGDDLSAVCEPRPHRPQTADRPRLPRAHAASAHQPGMPPEQDSPGTAPWPLPRRQVPQRRTDPDPPNDRAARRCPTVPFGERPSGHLLRRTCRPTFLIMRCPGIDWAPRIWPRNTKAVNPGYLGATALEAVGATTPADYRKVVPC